ncbi:MAG TPA: hypothetical protein VKZ59_02345, partial [Acidobacteriota bacterium]|nr:hypothetical protein [Acidobacteriota bacterium]
MTGMLHWDAGSPQRTADRSILYNKLAVTDSNDLSYAGIHYGRALSQSGRFQLVSRFTPSEDQKKAIEQLSKGLKTGKRGQILLGITGS